MANVSYIDMRKLLPLLALWLPLSVAARGPVEVVVSSAADGPVGTLTSDRELRAFDWLWSMKAEQLNRLLGIDEATRGGRS